MNSPAAAYENYVLETPATRNHLYISSIEKHDNEKKSFIHKKKREEHRNRFCNDKELLLVNEPEHTRRESFSSILSSKTMIDMNNIRPNLSDIQWEYEEISTILSLLNVSNVQNGLTTNEAMIRLQKDGPNSLTKNDKPSICITLFLQFYNLIVLLLLLAAIASISLQEYVEGFAVLFIIILNAIIATAQETQASNALDALAKMSTPSCTIIRDEGKKSVIDSKQLVKGDILFLSPGDVIPADARILYGNNLKVNEMILTGESEDVRKNERLLVRQKPVDNDFNASTNLTPENMIFSSTTVSSGAGTAIVVATAMQTRVGKIAALLTEKKSQKKRKIGRYNLVYRIYMKIDNKIKKYQPKLTPLQKSLHHLGILMGIFALSVCLIIFVTGFLRGQKDLKHLSRPLWLTMVMISVSLAVSAVPEGLPMVVTICLSNGTSEMVKNNVLIRKLNAIEALGAANIICTDKTGTLTEGKMTLVTLFTSFKDVIVTGKGFDPEKNANLLLDGKSILENSCRFNTETLSCCPDNPAVGATLLASILCNNTILYCSDRFIQNESSINENEEKWITKGSSTESPLLVAAYKVGLKKDDCDKLYNREIEVTFNSIKKRMITVNNLRIGNEWNTFDRIRFEKKYQYVACLKGAPNYIIQNCKYYLTDKNHGSVDFLSSLKRDEINKKIDQLSSQALRVLAIAIKPLETIQKECEAAIKNEENLANNLIFCGLVGCMDPERDGVKEAISTAANAGICTVMITGDYLKTAVAISKNINLIGAKILTSYSKKSKNCTKKSCSVDFIDVHNGPSETYMKNVNYDGWIRPELKSLVEHSDSDSFSENGLAVDCSILRYNDGDVERSNTQYIPDEEIDKITKRVVIFARAEPKDKYVIVQSFLRQGKVVAMTGDGVNDAPALKESDIGIAMGKTGTEVAKNAADLLLLDDNFVSIIHAIEKGRILVDNIVKFVVFLLSTNIGEIILIFFTIIMGLPLPLEPLQILILNLFSDGMPAIALSLEKGDPIAVMKRPPRKANDKESKNEKNNIITKRLWLIIIFNAVFIGASALSVYLVGLHSNFGTLHIYDLLAKSRDDPKAFIQLCQQDDRYKADEIISDPATLYEKYSGYCLSMQNIETDRQTIPSFAECMMDISINCVAKGVGRSQTMTFISITLTEIFRAYTVRNFYLPFYYDFLGNKYMHLASILSVMLTLVVTNVPYINKKIFGFEDIHFKSWLISIGFSFTSVILGEFLKILLRIYYKKKRNNRSNTIAIGRFGSLLEAHPVAA